MMFPSAACVPLGFIILENCESNPASCFVGMVSFMGKLIKPQIAADTVQ